MRRRVTLALTAAAGVIALVIALLATNDETSSRGASQTSASRETPTPQLLEHREGFSLGDSKPTQQISVNAASPQSDSEPQPVPRDDPLGSGAKELPAEESPPDPAVAVVSPAFELAKLAGSLDHHVTEALVLVADPTKQEQLAAGDR